MQPIFAPSAGYRLTSQPAKFTAKQGFTSRSPQTISEISDVRTQLPQRITIGHLTELGKGKQLRFNPAVLAAIESLARNKGRTLDRLADEAFRVLLKRNNRPVSLGEGLRASIQVEPANDPAPNSAGARR
jgi:hypothetical protein